MGHCRQLEHLDDAFPKEWEIPTNPILAVLFRFLCIISMSRPDLRYHWRSKIDDKEWETHREKVIQRLNNTNIAAGLVLTSSAVFISTQPPLTSLLSYTSRGSYILALGSFGHALGGLLCGLAVVNIYHECERQWAKEVMTVTRFRLCCTLLFVSWPVVSLTLSIIFLMLSLVIACYASGLWWLQFLVTVEVLSWAWLPPLFVWCALRATVPKEESDVIIPM